MIDDLFDVSGEGEAVDVVVRLHVVPGAGRSEVTGRHGDAVKVKVAAPPTGGRANQAVVDLIAETFGIKGTAVEVVSGDSSRSKRVRLKGIDEDQFRRILEQEVAGGNKPGGRGVRH